MRGALCLLLSVMAVGVAQGMNVAGVSNKADKINAAEDSLDAMDHNLAERETKTLKSFNEVTVKDVKAKIEEAKKERSDLAAKTQEKKSAVAAAQKVLGKIKKAQAAVLKDLKKDETELTERLDAHKDERSSTNSYAAQQKASVKKLRGIVTGMAVPV